jgi:hypothetical protein
MTFETSKNCENFPNGKIRLENLLIEQRGRNNMSLSGTLHMEAPLTEDMKVRKREIFLSLGEQALFIS